MEIKQSYDTSVFVEGAIREVYKTLLIAIGLVIFVIYLFLGGIRATVAPAVTVPVSIVASVTVLYALGFSVNLLTLLALVPGLSERQPVHGLRFSGSSGYSVGRQ